MTFCDTVLLSLTLTDGPLTLVKGHFVNTKHLLLFTRQRLHPQPLSLSSVHPVVERLIRLD